MPHATHESCAHCHQHHTLAVEALTVRYRAVCALEDIAFSTQCGNNVALVGPNGAGKSTLLKTIAGLLRPGAGRVLWRGSSVGRWSREIAYLPQREGVDWSFPITVRGVVEMGRYPQTGWWRSFAGRDNEAVERALSAMDLGGLEDRQISELSGGQQQRTFLARALAQEAHVLLLDEPFAGLDREAKLSLGATLRQLAEQGRLVMASHHDLESVPAFFDQVLLLRRRMVDFGEVGAVFTDGNLRRTFGGDVKSDGKEVA